VGLALGAVAVGLTIFLPHRPTFLAYVVAAVAGIGFATNWVFPWSMVPDVVDLDRARTGLSRAGVYFGMWALAFKFTDALALWISGQVLKLSGYVANAEQSTQALLGIRLFFGPVPAVIFALSLPLLIWYPVTRRSHERTLEKLRAL
jgi:GPH family glycoside/pentoside/hexuronide:cation symporter